MARHIDEYEAVFGPEEEEVSRTRTKEEDFEFDEIRGAHGRRRKLDALNKKKISKYELDELFCEF